MRIKNIARIAFIFLIIVVLAACGKDKRKIEVIEDGKFEVALTANGDSYELYKYIGEDKEITIPSSHRDLPITVIGSQAFKANKTIESVKISEAITLIDEEAFLDAIALKEIQFPATSKLVDIKTKAFAGAKSLSRMLIPDSVEKIASDAFRGASNAQLVTKIKTQPEGWKLDTHLVVYNYKETTVINGLNLALTNDSTAYISGIESTPKDSVLTIPSHSDGNEIVGILNAAFKDNESLEEIYFSNSVKYISGYAFANMHNLHLLSLPKSILMIYPDAFYNSRTANILIDENVDFTGWDPAWNRNGGLIHINLAEEIILDGVRYGLLNNDRAIVLGLVDKFGSDTVNIVGEIEGHEVTQVLTGGFQANEKIKFINIPDTVTRLENGVFSELKTIELINIPKSVEFIHPNALPQSPNTRIFTSHSLKPDKWFIESRVTMSEIYYKYQKGFLIDNLLYAHELNEDDETIGVVVKPAIDTVTDKLEILKSVEGVTISMVKANAFRNKTNITEVTFNDGMKVIGDSAFSGLTNLKTINFPDSITNIGTRAFEKAGKLAIIDIPANVVTIGNYAFANTPVIDLIIPDSVVEIGIAAFMNTTELEEVTFPDDGNLITIGNNAFNGAVKLTDVVIPSSVKTIGNFAFDKIPGLKTVTFADDGELTTIGNGAFANSALEVVTIPASVVTIGDSAFSGLKKLTSVIFADDPQLETIGASAFSQAEILESIFIPSSVLRIGAKAFENSPVFADIEFAADAQLTEIGASAFVGTIITSIDLPASLLSLGDSAFKGLENFTAVNFATNAKLTHIGAEAFVGTIITSIDLPASLLSIGDSAFKDLKTFTAVNFATDAKLTHIGAEAFVGTIITSIDLPASLLSIGDSAFKDLKTFTAVNFATDAKLTEIGKKAFAGTKITRIDLPATLLKIGESAFSGLAELKTVTFGKEPQLESIGAEAFSGAKQLTEIIIPETVLKMGSKVFKDCSQLVIKVEHPEAPEDWDKNWNPDKLKVTWKKDDE